MKPATRNPAETGPAAAPRRGFSISRLFEPSGDPPRRFDRLRKAMVLAVGAFMIGSIVYITARGTQSSFRLYERAGSAVFVDKYVDAADRRRILEGLEAATSSFLGRLGIDPSPGNGPVAYFFTDLHYGVLNAGDRLVRSRLDDRPSSDFTMFRTISRNFYANELVADSIPSREGTYVFVTVNGRWRESLLHAAVHAMAARNMPASLAAVLDADAAFSAPDWLAYRFVDETAALLVSDLYALAGDSGDLDAAVAGFAAAGETKYSLEEGAILDKEIEIWYATFNPPAKTTEYYRAANSFGAFLLGRLGRDGAFALVKRFLMGNYASLDEPFAAFGGLEGAMRAWKSDPGIPR